MDSPFMGAIAGGLSRKGWRVLRFEFPYMARQRSLGRRQGPDRMPVLQEAFREQAHLSQAELTAATNSYIEKAAARQAAEEQEEARAQALQG
jgi:predicted alpha/beta-hydrolase family hydrolase